MSEKIEEFIINTYSHMHEAIEAMQYKKEYLVFLNSIFTDWGLTGWHFGKQRPGYDFKSCFIHNIFGEVECRPNDYIIKIGNGHYVVNEGIFHLLYS